MTTATPSPRSTSSASPTLARASSKTHRLQRDKRSSNGSNRPRLRKQPKPPPPTLKDKLRAVTERRYFWPSAVLGLALFGGLLWQAISIASQASDATPSYRPTTPRPKRASTSAAHSPNPSPHSATTPARPIGDRLAEAVQGALSDTWNLAGARPESSEEVEAGGDSAARAGAGTGGAAREPAEDVRDNTPGAGERMRTLAELYADMEALGMNVDDMTQVLHRAQREADA